MKPKFMIAAAAAAFAIAGSGSAMAASYDLSKGTPTLVGGDDAFVNVTATGAFSDTYTFDLGNVGPSGTAYVTIIPLARGGSASVTNLTTSFYDLSTSQAAGSITGATTEPDGSVVALSAGQDYSVTLAGTGNTTYSGTVQFDVQTAVAPVPGPSGLLVALAGMGALFFMRRRIAGGLSA